MHWAEPEAHERFVSATLPEMALATGYVATGPIPSEKAATQQPGFLNQGLHVRLRELQSLINSK
jgi:hypothetical protein